jgi:hypothetical protein
VCVCDRATPDTLSVPHPQRCAFENFKDLQFMEFLDEQPRVDVVKLMSSHEFQKETKYKTELLFRDVSRLRINETLSRFQMHREQAREGLMQARRCARAIVVLAVLTVWSRDASALRRRVYILQARGHKSRLSCPPAADTQTRAGRESRVMCAAGRQCGRSGTASARRRKVS